ncbi:MAG: PhzF family phenazine biosynthesis protein [Sphingomonadales bacterium]|jgi:trans-2,3-dihydro-3-hydroxyanthranilate isomerase
MQFPYVTCDVFTNQAFGGNQLAVVYDADGLNSAQMQRIAAEFNYSETTFVLKPKDPAHTAEVRIFTPAEELPFAGHPNVGTAVALARRLGLTDVKTFEFEEKAGLVPVEVTSGSDGLNAAKLTAPLTPKLGQVVETSSIEKLLGLADGSILTERHAPVVVDVGAHFLMIEVDSLTHLGEARSPSLQEARKLGDFEFYLYTRDAPETDFRARMFAPGLGIVEDPATGGAATALAGVLSELEPGDCHSSWTLDQGVEMGRPSRLHIELIKTEGEISKITVGGEAIMMMEGILTCPSN